MVDLDRLQPSEKAVAEGEERKSEGGEEHKLEEGPDVRFNERLLKRIETLKRAVSG